MASPRTDRMGLVSVPPTTGAAGASLAATCDPAIVGLLADFKTILNAKLSAAWTAAAGSAMPTSLIVDTYPHEPTAGIAQRTWIGPALFMWRLNERYFKRTTVWDDAECTVKALFVLPAMPEELALKLEPIRAAVRTVLVEFVEHFGDPTLKPGVLLSTYGLESFTWQAFEYGYLPASAGVDLAHPALDMTAVMRERESFVASQYALLGSIATVVSSKTDTGETDVDSALYTVPIVTP